MSATNSYKTVTLSRDQAFAVVRGLRRRIDEMTIQAKDAENGDPQIRKWIADQLVAAQCALDMINAVPFVGGLREAA